MKLQYLKRDYILPRILYHPKYALSNLIVYNNYSGNLDNRRSSMLHIKDSPNSLSSNSSQYSESDTEEEDTFIVNSEEKSTSLISLHRTNNSLQTLPYDQMMDKKHLLQSELHSQTKETVFKLPDIVKKIKFRDENFNAILSTSFEHKLEIRKEFCSILEDFGTENFEMASGDLISLSTETSGIKKLINEKNDEDFYVVSQNESLLSSTPYLFISNDAVDTKKLTFMESHVKDHVNEFESFKSEEITDEKIFGTNASITFTEKHKKSCTEQISKNCQILTPHWEKETISTSAKTDIKFLHLNVSDLSEKPASISVTPTPVPEVCGIKSKKSLSLAKINFSHKIQSTFSKSMTVIAENIEAFESKLKFFENDTLNWKNCSVLKQNMVDEKLKLIPYKNEAISSHPPTADNGTSIENVESNVNESNNDGWEKKTSDPKEASTESTTYEPETEKLSDTNDSDQQKCTSENLCQESKTESKGDLYTDLDSEFEEDETFVSGDDLWDMFSDDEEGDSFFDSFDDLVFDSALGDIGDTELMFNNEPPDSKGVVNLDGSKEKEEETVLISDLPMVFKCVDDGTLESKEMLLYTKEHLEALVKPVVGESISRDEAIKQLIRESKTYEGKQLGIVPDIKDPRFSSHTEKKESDPDQGKKCLQLLENNSAGGSPATFSSITEPQTPSHTESNSSFPPEIDRRIDSRCRNKSRELIIKSQSKQTYPTASKYQKSIPLFLEARSCQPKDSSVCVHYQRQYGIIPGRRSISAPLIQTIKENARFGCERYKRYSSYYFSPRGALAWGHPDSGGLVGSVIRNKKVKVEEIVSSDFRTHFQFHAKRGRLKSGSVISKANSKAWLKKTGVICDSRSEKIAEDCFAKVAGKKLVLNIFDYIKYLIAVSRKSGLALMDIVNRLKGKSELEYAISKKFSYSSERKGQELPNLQTWCPPVRKCSCLKPLFIRSSKIPVHFGSLLRNCRNLKQ